MENGTQQGAQSTEAKGSEGQPDVAAIQKRAEESDARAKKMEGLAKNFEKQLEAFKGIDPQRVKALEEEVENFQKEKANQNPEALEEWKKGQEAKIRKTVSDEVTTLRDENEKLKRTNKTLEVTDKVTGQISSLINDDVLDLVKSLIERTFDKHDGEIVAKDENGNILYSKQNPTQRMTPTEWAQLLVESKPSLGRSTAVAGSGTTAGKTTTGVAANQGGKRVAAPPLGFEGWTIDQKQAWFTENPEGARSYMRGRF